jgi:hypothetical protein
VALDVVGAVEVALLSGASVALATAVVSASFSLEEETGEAVMFGCEPDDGAAAIGVNVTLGKGTDVSAAVAL